MESNRYVSSKEKEDETESTAKGWTTTIVKRVLHLAS